MAKVQSKKKESTSSKVSLPDLQTEAATSSKSLGGASRRRFNIWPEWNDLEVIEDKWDLSKGPEDAKKNKTPIPILFEDPEGKISLPPSLKVHSWKRPTEFIVNQRITVVKYKTTFDLISRNDHLMCSEMMRRIISEIYIAWNMHNNTKRDAWRPWDHIYSLTNLEKGQRYNDLGKYEIRLYWMGGWKKIIVDDLLPFDEENNLLLPASTCQSELWPMLLAKALIKVANTSIKSDCYEEMGEYTFLHNFTGWMTKITPLTTYPSPLEETWAVLQDTLPKFEHPDARGDGSKSKLPKSKKSKGTHEAVVCASFFNLDPTYWNFLKETADSSHALRQNGLCLMHSHIVLLRRTRTCPLEAPPKPPPIARWKLIRPKKKKIVPTSEPPKIPVVKPLQFIEIASPFLNNRGKSSAGPTPKQEDKQGAKGKRFRGSPLLSIAESEETECKEDLEPEAAERTADSPDSTTDKTEVTAKDSKKDNADISNDSPQPSLEESVIEEPSAPSTPTLQETWVHLEDFVKCFQTLLVFHKPQIYRHQAKTSHFKKSVLSKTALLTNFPGSSTHGSFPETNSVSDTECQMLCEKVYMCVESVQPIQFLISFSVLKLWGNKAKATAKESKDAARRKRMYRMAEEGHGDVSVSVHWWKSRQLQEPFVFFRTTSSKTDVFKLPRGRYVFVVLGRGPLGFNVHVCSETPFVFGDEDTVMPHLSKESIRFTERASSILSALTRVVSSFSDEQNQPEARRLLEEAHCPQNITTALEKVGHRKVFNSAVYKMLREALGRKLSSEKRFAILALTADPSLLATDHEEHSARPDAESKPPESWRDREPTDEEVKAATVLQAGFKGHLVREILKASKPGTKENLSASKILLTMWRKVESHAKKHASLLLRFIIDHPERKAELYPCQRDEYTRVSFADYSGSIPDTNTSPWLLVLREVFMVPKKMLMMAKVYSQNRANPLYIINNDTGEDLHNICNKEGSCIYQPNKLGYTIVAGVYPYESSHGAKWKLRLIGSRELPKLYKTPLLVKEIQDYYFPQDDNIICRYFVQVTEDVMGTIQFYTSKSSVQIRLSILDQEKEVVSKTGILGYVDIPVFRFQANEDEKDQNQKGSPPTKGSGVKMEDTPQESDEEDGAAEESDSSSDQNQPPTDEKDQDQNQKGSPHTKDTGVKVEDTPQESDEEDGAAGGSDPSSDQNQPPTETKGHKYVIQAEVLKKSWHLDESQLAFVQELKELRDKEIGERIEDVNSLSTDSEPQDKSDTSGTNIQGGSRQSLDLTKANWTLIVTSDKTKKENIMVTKDTEKLDRMIAMLRGLELEDPGRRARNIETHEWYLQQDKIQNDDESYEGRVKWLTRYRRKRDPDSMPPDMKRLWEKVQPKVLEQEKRWEQEKQEWQQHLHNMKEQSKKWDEEFQAREQEKKKKLAESWADCIEQCNKARAMFWGLDKIPGPEEAQQAVLEEAPPTSAEEAQKAVKDKAPPTSAATQKSKKHAKKAGKKK